MKTTVNIQFQSLLLTLALVCMNVLPVLSQNVTEPQCYGGNRMLREFIREEMVYPEVAIT